MKTATALHPRAVLGNRLQACKAHVAAHCRPVVGTRATAVVLFLSIASGSQAAWVRHAVSADFETAWELLRQEMSSWLGLPDADGVSAVIRLDWAVQAQPLPWRDYLRQWGQAQAGHLDGALALDTAFDAALTTLEIEARALLTPPAADDGLPTLHTTHWRRYAAQRFAGGMVPPLDADRTVFQFTTAGVYCDEHGTIHPIERGRQRALEATDADRMASLMEPTARLLADCVTPDGRILDMTLADAGGTPRGQHKPQTMPLGSQLVALHGLVQAWAVLRSPALKSAVGRAIRGVAVASARTYRLAFGQAVAYVVDGGSETARLGDNAMAVLALARYCEVSGERRHIGLMERLAAGMLCLQEAQSGRFDHTVVVGDLAVQQPFEDIEQDGQAVLALLRLYELTGDLRWISGAEKAVEYLIAQRQWQRGSAWLGLAVNLLTRYRPLEMYFSFGVRHITGQMESLVAGDQASPEALELAVAGHLLARRLARQPALYQWAQQLDGDRLQAAVTRRAGCLFGRYAWPEVAMYAHRPDAVTGVFLLAGERVQTAALAQSPALSWRADDAARCLTACAAYHAHLSSRSAWLATGEGAAPAALSPVAAPRAARGLPALRSMLSRSGAALPASQDGNWTAHLMASATEGRWVSSPGLDWRSSGPALGHDQSRLMRVAVLRGASDNAGMPVASVHKLLPFCSGIMATDANLVPAELAHLPLLIVEDAAAAVNRLGSHARSRFFGDVIGVTGSVGKTSMVAMLAEALRPLGVASHTQQGTALPLNVAAEMACMPQDASCWIVEMAVEGMLANAQLARPSVAVVTSLAPMHLSLYGSIERMARKTSAIFSHMRFGGHAVLRRDMPHYTLIERVARTKGLHVLTYGDHDEADVSLVAAGNGQVRALVQGEEVVFPLAMPGRHMAVNALGVVATLLALELPLDVALRQFAYMQPLPGRGQRFHIAVQDGGQATVIDDAASASPESMKAALALLAQAPCAPSQRVAVLGDMLELGADAPRYHLELEQELLQASVGRVMLHGPLMRGLHERLAQHTPSQWFDTLEALDQALARNLHTGDWVLIKGSAAMGFQTVVERLRTFA